MINQSKILVNENFHFLCTFGSIILSNIPINRSQIILCLLGILDIATHRPYRLCISSSASSIKQTLPFSISAIPFEISVTNCFLVSLRIVRGSFAVNFISKGIPLYITTASKTYRLHWIQKYRVDPPLLPVL